MQLVRGKKGTENKVAYYLKWLRDKQAKIHRVDEGESKSLIP